MIKRYGKILEKLLDGGEFTLDDVCFFAKQIGNGNISEIKATTLLTTLLIQLNENNNDAFNVGAGEPQTRLLKDDDVVRLSDKHSHKF